MSAPLIFNGRRAKMLTQDGILRADGSIIDNNGTPNLIKNGHAEINVTGWTVSKNTVAASRPDSGFVTSSTNITWTRNTTNPIDGQADFLYTKDAANRQGEQVYCGFTVAKKYRAKVLQIEVDYLVNSGTFSAGSSSTDSDVILYIYDVTNSTFIEPSSFKFLSNSSTIADKFIANFQTSATGSSYRILFHQATTSTSAFAVQFKDVSIKPCNYVYGTPISDWVSFTPTGSWSSNTTYTGIWRRIGSNAEIKYNVATSGAPTASQLTLNLPSGLTIDTTKMLTTSNTTAIGYGSTLVVAAYPIVPTYKSTSDFYVRVLGHGGTYDDIGTLLTNTIPNTYGASSEINTTVFVPITGWSSSTQVSDGYDGRLVSAAVYRATSSQTINSASDVKIQWNGKTKDTTSSFDSNTNYRFTAPSYGTYRHSGQITISATGSSTIAFALLYKNGSALKTLGSVITSTSAATTITFSIEDDAVASDYYEIYFNSNSVSMNINSDSSIYGGSQWYITKQASPQTMSATEEVLFVGKNSASTSIATTGTYIPFTSQKDTHGAWSTDTFTCPIYGDYEVIAGLHGSSTSNYFYAQVEKGGVNHSRILQNESRGDRLASGSTIVENCNAGTTIKLNAFSDTASQNLNSSAVLNYIMIKRIK